MTEATTKAAGGAADTAGSAPSDALKAASQQLLTLLVQRAAEAATDRVSDLSDRLTSVSENGGEGLASVFGGGGSDDDEDDSSSGGGIGERLAGLKDKVTGMLGGGDSGGGGGTGGSKKLKMTQIVEDLDVGLPLRTTYDMWTQYADFPSFMKKVESVEQASDETTNWTAKIVWSRRTWEATTLEQVPDSHIVFNSKGPKGHVDGAISFTEIGPNLTRILLVLEYWPKGLFERTGNIWRAQGRRARLEFQHFRRHAMTNVMLRQEEIEGWRGEIRDGEVVKTHEEAMEEEQRARDEEGPADEQDEDAASSDTDDTSDDTDDTYDDDYDDEEAEETDDEAEDDEDTDDEYEDEDTDDEADDEDTDDEPSTGADDGQSDAGRRAEPVAAGRSRRGR